MDIKIELLQWFIIFIYIYNHGFLMFNQIFYSLPVNRNVIISNKRALHELSFELSID